MADTVEGLEARRAQLLRELAQTGDMRQGSISENYRACGKPQCCCTASDHPGHGPYYAFTRKVAGKTKTLNLRPGALLTKIQREVETYQQFRRTSQQLLGVNEKICDARPVGEVSSKAPVDSLKKKSRRSSRQKSHKK
jgi:hypothetical protein